MCGGADQANGSNTTVWLQFEVAVHGWEEQQSRQRLEALAVVQLCTDHILVVGSQVHSLVVDNPDKQEVVHNQVVEHIQREVDDSRWAVDSHSQVVAVHNQEVDSELDHTVHPRQAEDNHMVDILHREDSHTQRGCVLVIFFGDCASASASDSVDAHYAFGLCPEHRVQLEALLCYVQSDNCYPPCSHQRHTGTSLS